MGSFLWSGVIRLVQRSPRRLEEELQAQTCAFVLISEEPIYA